jgi:hypothetical protein
MCRKSKKMKFVRHMAGIAGLAVMCIFSCKSPAAAQDTPNYEYRLKATFMYQFVNFIDGWKFELEKGENNKNNENKRNIILLGIIGKDPFGDAFKPLMEKTIRDRKIEIRHFEGFSKLNSQNENVTVHPEIDKIKKCDLIFVCSSERQYINEILTPLRKERILTIADTDGFLEKGSIINFIIDKSKVRFEINVVAAKRAKLTIRSKLLRLATQVIMEDEIEDK